MSTLPQEDLRSLETSVDVAQIVQACARPLPAARRSLIYRASVWTSAAALLLVTALYFTLVVLIAWVACDYFISHVRLLQSDEQIGQILLYALPPVFVLALLALMVKPMFQVRVEATEPRRLRYSDAPLLFDLVERICQNVKTPMVDEIRVLLGSNGSVQMKGAMGGLFSKRRQLNLGLSLVSGFTIQELAGVIAHEMGHFSLDRNIRLLALIRLVNGWFGRAIYERDAFDLRLENGTRPGAPYRYLLFPILWIVVAGRGVLRPFYFLSEAASCLISRKDEYDCDQYMAGQVGSLRSIDALKKSYLLDLASDMSMSEMDSSWLERRLPDNLPRMVAARAGRFSGRQVDISYKLMTFQKGSWLSSHPSLADRIAAVRRLGIDDLNAADGPATLLLPNFDQVARELTTEFYQLLLKEEFQPEYLVDAETLNREFQEDEKMQRTLRRYLQTEPNFCRPIFPSKSYGSARSSVEHASQNLATTLQTTSERLAKFEKTSNEMLQHRHAGNELRVYDRLSQLGFVSNVDLKSMLKRHEEEYARVCREYDELAGPIRQRMTLALQLLSTPEFREQYPSDEWESHAQRTPPILAACELLQDQEPAFETLVVETETLSAIGANVGFDSIPFVAQREVDRLSESIADRLTSLRNRLNLGHYPLARDGQKIRLGDFLIPKIPASRKTGELLGASIESLQRTDKLTSRCLSLIAETGELVESRLGLSHQEDRKDLDWWEQLDAELDKPRRRSAEPASAAALSPVLGLIVAAISGGLIAALGAIGERTSKSLPHHPSYQPTIVPTRWTETYHASAMPNYGIQPGGVRPDNQFNGDPLVAPYGAADMGATTLRPPRTERTDGLQDPYDALSGGARNPSGVNYGRNPIGQRQYLDGGRNEVNPFSPNRNAGDVRTKNYNPNYGGGLRGSPTPGPSRGGSGFPGSSLPGRGFP